MCYRTALKAYTRREAPTEWAAIQNNLGATLSDQAGLAEGAEQARLLEEAVAVYQAALEVRTPQSLPVEWAQTQNYLGTALRAQAELAEGEERVRLLEEAVAAYQAALEVYTRQNTPADWAMTQSNLALLHLDRVRALEEEETDALCQALKEVWECITRSLKVYTREAMPADTTLPWIYVLELRRVYKNWGASPPSEPSYCSQGHFGQLRIKEPVIRCALAWTHSTCTSTSNSQHHTAADSARNSS